MVEPFFFAVTRTPSIGPSAAVTCPESPGSACAVTAPRLAAASATARLAAVDNNTCFIRIMITPRYVLSWYVPSGERPKHPDLIQRSAASLRRVSKDGHRRERARGHPSSFESLRTAARRARPPQDEV